MVGITDAFNPMDTFHEIWHGFTHLMVRLGGMISSQNRDNSTGSDLNLVEKDEALLTALKNENLEEPKKENLDDE